MAGLTAGAPTPQNITVSKLRAYWKWLFPMARCFACRLELMRVYSPSAEVKGHGPGQETLQTGKRQVDIAEIGAVGNYAIQPRFGRARQRDLPWDYLYFLGDQQDALWPTGAAAGSGRGPRRAHAEKTASSCGGHDLLLTFSWKPFVLRG